MSSKPLYNAPGFPTFCWQCNRQLQRAPGPGLGLFYFQLVVDRAGVAHRVHGECEREATNDGLAKVLV